MFGLFWGALGPLNGWLGFWGGFGVAALLFGGAWSFGGLNGLGELWGIWSGGCCILGGAQGVWGLKGLDFGRLGGVWSGFRGALGHLVWVFLGGLGWLGCFGGA